MKKAFVLILSILIIQNTNLFLNYEVFAYSSSSSGIAISNKELNESTSNIHITGNYPEVTGVSSKSLQKEIDDKLNKIYDAGINLAKKSNSTYLNFDYKYSENNGVYSIVIETTLTSGYTKQYVDTVNFDINANKMLYVSDVLGPNGVEVVNKYIYSEMNKAPENYKDFKGITDDQDFYLYEGYMYILFDENEISSKSKGINNEFRIEVASVIDYTLTEQDYIVEDGYGLKLIPLRKTAEGLGYTVNWNEKEQLVEVSRGNFSTTLKEGQNIYYNSTGAKKELEAPPQNINGNIYVPISFFDNILQDTYTVMSDGDIVFTTYLY